MLNRRFKIICAACAICMCCASCSDSQDHLEEAGEEESEALEKYSEEAVETKYDNLYRVSLHNNGLTVEAYAMEDYDREDDSVSSEKMGVSLSETLYDADESGAEGEILEEEFTKQYNKAEDDGAVDIQIADVSESEDCLLQALSYTIQDGQTAYPCAVYIKIDRASANGYLKTVICVDNREAGEGTSGLLTEVLEACGITMEE